MCGFTQKMCGFTHAYNWYNKHYMGLWHFFLHVLLILIIYSMDHAAYGVQGDIDLICILIRSKVIAWRKMLVIALSP